MSSVVPRKSIATVFDRKEWIFVAGSLIASIVAGLLTVLNANAVLTFIVSGVALALLAELVGLATDQLGSRLSAGATGVLQSSLSAVCVTEHKLFRQMHQR